MLCPFTQHECNAHCSLSDSSVCAIYRIAGALENVAYELAARRGFDRELTEEERESLGKAFREVAADEQQAEGQRRGT